MKDVRVWFEKTSCAKYISHLDLVRCMGRAIKKACLPIWYTQGFNPHPCMTFALPLSLGISGKRESMDIRLTENISLQHIRQKLNEALPEGIRVIDVTQKIMPPKSIAAAVYEIRLSDSSGSNDKLKDALSSLMAKEKILVDKKTKSGIREVNLRPHISEYVIKDDGDALKLIIVLPAGSVMNINPNLVVNALIRYETVEPYTEITRMDVYNEKLESFV